MYRTIRIAKRRVAFTLVEMLVVIGIILVLAALAAAFAPRISDDTSLSRSVDSLEQWLLTAKMRAKRDNLATGLRFIQQSSDIVDPNDPALHRTYSQFQYIQQPDPLVGGSCVGGPPTPLPPPPAYQYPQGTGNYYNGGTILSAGQVPAGSGVVMVTFGGVDFTMGQTQPPTPNQWLVQPGDFLEIRGSGVYMIGQVSLLSPTNTLVLGQPNAANPYANPPTPSGYDLALSITTPTPNYRILRQPRLLIGEEPLFLPNNYVVDTRIIPGPATAAPPIPQDGIIPGNWYPPPYPPAPAPPAPPTSYVYWSNVANGSSGYPEILFSPSGAIVGSNAVNGMIFITTYDVTMNPFDMTKVGIVAVQTRTGFIGAYGAPVGAGLAGYNPFFLAQIGRESGL